MKVAEKVQNVIKPQHLKQTKFIRDPRAELGLLYIITTLKNPKK